MQIPAGSTALHVASTRGNDKSLKMLVEYKADVTVLDSVSRHLLRTVTPDANMGEQKGNTALQTAATEECRDILRVRSWCVLTSQPSLSHLRECSRNSLQTPPGRALRSGTAQFPSAHADFMSFFYS